MEAAWLIFRIRNLSSPGWQRRRDCNRGIPAVLMRNINLRLLIHYISRKKMWN